MKNVEKLIAKENQTIECKSCGTTFNIWLDKCPNCGTANEYGSEYEYLEKLDDIHENLEDISNIPIETVKDEAKKSSKTIFKVFFTILIIAGLIFAIFLYATKKIEDRNFENYKELITWQKTNFPKLDEWYEAGDFDAILKFENDMYLAEDYNYSTRNLWDWDHYEFMLAYKAYDSSVYYNEHPEDMDNEITRIYAFYDAMQLVYENWEAKLDPVNSITKREYNLIMGYKEEALAFLNDQFGLSEDMVMSLKDDICYDPPGVGVDYNKCKTYVKEHYGE